MIDAFSIVIPDTHVWAVITCWVAGYIGGRHMAALR